VDVGLEGVGMHGVGGEEWRGLDTLDTLEGERVEVEVVVVDDEEGLVGDAEGELALKLNF